MKFFTYDDIKTKLIQRIKAYNPEADISFTKQSRFGQIVLATAKTIETAQSKAKTMYDNLHINTADEEGLENKLIDRGLHRMGASSAQVVLRIGSKKKPEANINIPQLFQVSTGEKDAKVFQTIETAILKSTTKPDNRGFYTIEVIAQSLRAGSDTNIKTGTINKILTQIPSIDVVYNENDAFGGRDIESIESMRNRLYIKNKTYVKGSIPWFISETRNVSDEIKDVYVNPRPQGNGTVKISITTYGGEVPDSVLEEVENHFAGDTDLNNQGEFNVVVSRIEKVLIHIDLSIEVNGKCDFTQNDIENIIREYFDTQVLVEKDFINWKLSSYIISKIDTTNIYDIEYKTPEEDIVINHGQIAVLGSLNIEIYKTEYN